MGAGTKFRQVLAKNGLVEAMAAHSPLSAMLLAKFPSDDMGFQTSSSPSGSCCGNHTGGPSES